MIIFQFHVSGAGPFCWYFLSVCRRSHSFKGRGNNLEVGFIRDGFVLLSLVFSCSPQLPGCVGGCLESLSDIMAKIEAREEIYCVIAAPTAAHI